MPGKIYVVQNLKTFNVKLKKMSKKLFVVVNVVNIITI